MDMTSGGSTTAVRPLFQGEGGGSTPTPPLQCHQYALRVQHSTGVVPDVNMELGDSRIHEMRIADVSPIILEYEWLGCMPGWSCLAYGHYFSGVLVAGGATGGVVLLGHTTGSDKAFTKMFPGKRVIVHGLHG